MTTPFGRLGGKSRIAKEIINYFPNDYDLYVEPFLGAGNIFLRLPENKQTNPMILNDLDNDVYIVFKELQKNSKYINDNLIRNTITKKEFKSLLNKKDAISIIQKLKNSFLCKGQSFNANRGRIQTNYQKIGEKLKNTIILNTNFKDIIEKYDNTNTFFYLDPPYESKRKDNYKHTTVTPEELYNSIKNIKGRFILSYNNSDNIKNLFSKFNIYFIQTEYNNTTAKDKQKLQELLISNFPLI